MIAIQKQIVSIAVSDSVAAIKTSAAPVSIAVTDAQIINPTLDRQFIAAELIGGQRLVALNSDSKAVLFQPATHSNPIGLTTHAATANSPVQVRTFGQITGGGWDYPVNTALYAAPKGLLSPTPHAVATIEIARVLANDLISINIRDRVQNAQ